jgi:cyclohexanone monooxygenase
MLDKAANAAAAEFVRSRIREIVKDERTAEKLLPHDHPIGAKRICIDTDYFDTYNRGNVTLVDIRSAPIEAMSPEGVRTKDAFYELDALVFATGFDAVTGSLAKIDIRGRSGRALSEKWAGGPRSYLGLMTAGFPNFFTITGPGSPSILTNVVVSIEQHVEWIGAAIAHLEANGVDAMDADAEAEDAWVAHVDEVAHRTLFVLANSWYMGANIPGKPRVFMPYAGGFNAYRLKCEEVVALGYEGFTFDKLGTASQAHAALEASVS